LYACHVKNSGSKSLQVNVKFQADTGDVISDLAVLQPGQNRLFDKKYVTHNSYQSARVIVSVSVSDMNGNVLSTNYSPFKDINSPKNDYNFELFYDDKTKKASIKESLPEVD